MNAPPLLFKYETFFLRPCILVFVNDGSRIYFHLITTRKAKMTRETAKRGHEKKTWNFLRLRTGFHIRTHPLTVVKDLEYCRRFRNVFSENVIE